MPILIHGGRGLPPIAAGLGRLVDRHPGAELIIAHAGIADMAGLAHVFDGRAGVFFDTSAWSPVDLLDFYRQVSPEQVALRLRLSVRAAAELAAHRRPHGARAPASTTAAPRHALQQRARIALGEPPLEPTPPRGSDIFSQPMIFARIHGYLSMATPLLWMRQPDTFGVLGLALNACDERNGAADTVELEQIRELIACARDLWRELPDDRGRPRAYRGARGSRSACSTSPTSSRSRQVPELTLTVNGEQRSARGRGTHAARARPARRARADGRARRLRHEPVRRVHRPRRRPRGEELHDARRSRPAGSEVTTIEGLTATDGELHPVQQAFVGTSRAPVRLLHARHDPDDDRSARRATAILTTKRSGTRCAGTFAAAPATTRSSTRCARRRRRRREDDRPSCLRGGGSLQRYRVDGSFTARARRRDRALAEAPPRVETRCGKGGGPWGNHGFPHPSRGWRVIPAAVDYVRPGSLEEALDALAQPDAKLLAGGQSPAAGDEAPHLTPIRGGRHRWARAERHRRAGRRARDRRSGHLGRAGALRRAAGACWRSRSARAGIGDLQVRNRGTIGGGLAHADPASDMPAVTIALGSDGSCVRSTAGERTMDASELALGPFMTSLAEGELITEVAIPLPPAGSGSAYVAIEHPASGFALAGAAALVSADGSRTSRSDRSRSRAVPARRRARRRRAVRRPLRAGGVPPPARTGRHRARDRARRAPGAGGHDDGQRDRRRTAAARRAREGDGPDALRRRRLRSTGCCTPASCSRPRRTRSSSASTARTRSRSRASSPC